MKLDNGLNYLIIAVLILVAGGLGYLIYLQNYPGKSSSNVVLNPTPAPQTSTQTNPIPGNGSPPVDLFSAVKFPDASTSAEEKKKFLSIMNNFAQQTDTISIKQCNQTPMVAKVKLNSQLQVKNEDAQAHTLAFSTGSKYTVEAYTTKSISANFGKGVGVYALKCDQNKAITGAVVLY